MSKAKIRKQTDWVSRLGCMRRNIVIEDSRWGQVEHIDLWVPESNESVPTLKGVAGSRRATKGSGNVE